MDFNLGSGEVAQISLHHVEGGTTIPRLGEMFDESAEQTVVFNEGYPGVVYTKEVQIKNYMYVVFLFFWRL